MKHPIYGTWNPFLYHLWSFAKRTYFFSMIILAGLICLNFTQPDDLSAEDIQQALVR